MAGAIRCDECKSLVPTAEFLAHRDDHFREHDQRQQDLIDWLEGLLTVEEPTS